MISVTVVHAQFGTPATFPTVAGDTLNNVDTVAKVISASAGYNEIGIQVNLNQISGTVAGKVYLYGSMDNTNFTIVDSATYHTVAPGNATSTFGVRNGYTHMATMTETHAPYWRYIVAATSTGTVSAPVQVLYTLRKYSTAP